MKTIKFFTLGCKVNQYDTQSIRERFIGAGFKQLNNGQLADIYLINTCTVTSRADSDSLNLIRRARRENPRAKIIVTGCLVKKDRAALAKIKGIDFVIAKEFFPQGISNFCGHTRAFLKIQDGCDNFCSYCKVPLVRGASRSRPLGEIINEAKQLVENGFKEIVLTGICLGAYGKKIETGVIASEAKQSFKKIASSLSSPRNDTGALSLIDVIRELEKMEGLLRIRLSSIEATDVTDELINKITKSKKLCQHLHIPIQSGDNDILRKMNRRYTHQAYLNLIRRIKRKIPSMAITTDVLVGFPGESEENFQNTLTLVKKVAPLKTHIFPYSVREATLAATLKERVSSQVIRERIARLKKAADSCSRQYKKRFLGKKIPALIEGKVKDKAGYWRGYTDNYIEVKVKAEQDLKNQLILLKLRRISGDYVLADIC